MSYYNHVVTYPSGKITGNLGTGYRVLRLRSHARYATGLPFSPPSLDEMGR
jgi:hypothetical protein